MDNKYQADRKRQESEYKRKTLAPLVHKKAMEAYNSGFECEYDHGESQEANIFLAGVTWGYNTRNVYCEELMKLVDELNEEIRSLKQRHFH